MMEDQVTFASNSPIQQQTQAGNALIDGGAAGLDQ
jgi:hypothetical protein